MVPLNGFEWLACLAIGAFSLGIGAALRLWPTPEAIDTARYNVEIKEGSGAAKMATQTTANPSRSFVLLAESD